MRRWLARMLCPEAFKAADQTEERLHYLRVRLSELETWCGYGFPEIKAAVEWVRKSERVHFMSLGDYDSAVARAAETSDYAGIMVGGIDRFRDEISDRFDRRPGRA